MTGAATIRMGRAPKVPGAVPEDGDLNTLALAAPAIPEEIFAFVAVSRFDLPYVGAYDQAIRILGYPKRGTSAPSEEERHSCTVVASSF